VLGRTVQSPSRVSDHFRNLCTISGTHSHYTVTTHLTQVAVNSCGGGGTCSFYWNRITLGNSVRDEVSNVSATVHYTYPMNSIWLTFASYVACYTFHYCYRLQENKIYEEHYIYRLEDLTFWRCLAGLCKFLADVTGLSCKPTENGLLFCGQQKDATMALALEHATTNFQELSG
jgi:uncharacterized membrane protein